MIIGFTGTRHGMTAPQMETVAKLLSNLINTVYLHYFEAHHGDCVGGDAEFHNICRRLDFNKIIAHPPKDDRLRAYCKVDIILPEKNYKDRNQDIVNAADYIIGAPNSKIFQPRGGTFQTIKFAETKGNLYRVVFPDGSAIAG